MVIRASRLGTIVRLPDGRIGTTVYNGLDGVGIKWGRHKLDMKLFEGSSGGLFRDPDDVRARLAEWHPEAMLREPYSCADLPCVGEDFEIVDPENDDGSE